MDTRTKVAFLVMLSVGMLMAVAMSTVASSVTPAFAKKKECDRTEDGCDAKTLKNQKYLLGGNESTTRSDHGENDSNIVDEKTTLDESHIEVDNSTSSSSTSSTIEGSPFALPTM